ncbi:MAG: hypothetical protein DME26_15615 [Verrucomicrobia bacterium]|nr:MAG: hypothetical protein DME26_15615 [Verrucomicrobiota bacterium]
MRRRLFHELQVGNRFVEMFFVQLQAREFRADLQEHEIVRLRFLRFLLVPAAQRQFPNVPRRG